LQFFLPVLVLLFADFDARLEILNNLLGLSLLKSETEGFFVKNNLLLLNPALVLLGLVDESEVLSNGLSLRLDFGLASQYLVQQLLVSLSQCLLL
jgi:hypothetical protein